ncbi:MAG: replication initiator protein A [Oscillospiraceae bacterium]|nr:replication initiator protein A [Oscillospiraceae bacterium]
MPLQLRYFYGGEADQFNFYRIPKALFTDRRFGKLSMEAKVLYGLLLDRMCLSTENGWFDGQGRVYIFFTLEDAMAMLGYGKDKLVRVFKELDVIGLIERKKQGLGRPTIIYVKNFVLPPEPAEPPPSDREQQNPEPDKTSGKPKSGLPDSQTSEKPKSGLRQDRSPDFAKTDTNDTERNDTECSDTDLSIYPQPLSLPDRSQGQPCPDRMDWMDGFKEQVKFNIEYDRLLRERPCDAEIIDGYVELITDACCGSKATVRICRDEIPVAMVRKRFLMLTYEHIKYVLSCLNNTTTRVANVRAYTLATLYNAPLTMEQFYTMQAGYDMACGK